MEELIKACSDYRSGDYSTLQLWFNVYYTTIDNAKVTYGWDSVVDCINKNTNQSLIKKNILNRYYIAKKKHTSGKLVPKENIKQNINLSEKVKTDLEVKNTSVEIDYPIEFDDYSQLTRSTKIALFKNNLTVADFESIGILNDYDQNSVSKKVRAYISNAKLAEKSKSLSKYQD
ncbi:TPA: hypothetical protein ACS7ZV_003553 [Providencia alcalifaciens]